MVLPRDSFQMQVQGNVLQSWQQLIKSMEESLDLLEKGIDEASEMRHICTDEWCVATEHVLDELSNGLFPSASRAGLLKQTARSSKH